MKEAAVELLDAAIVSCPPYCRRRTRPVPMAAKADDLPYEPQEGRAVVPCKRPLQPHSDDRQLRVDYGPQRCSGFL